MWRYTAIVLLTFLPICLPAQGSSFTFRNISINQGLSQSSVVDIAIDKAGFVWLATQDGINRFDGKDFVVFQKNFDDITTLTANKLGKIITAGDKELWLITSGGRWEKLDLYSQTFVSQPTAGKNKQLISDISCLYPGDKEQWIGTETNGVYINRSGAEQLVHLSTQSKPVALNSNNIQEIFHDSRKQYWVLTDNGVTRISDDLQSSQHFLSDEKPGKFLSSSLTEDKNGTLWLGSFGNGLYYKKVKDSSFHLFSGFGKNESLPGNLVIEALLSDQQNRLWVGSYGKGLFIIDKTDSVVHHLLADKNNPFSLGYNDILTIKEDRYGGVWIGTDGGGLSYYDKRLNNFQSFSRNNIPSAVAIDQVRAISTDKAGNIWIGTSNNGLTYIAKNPAYSETFRFFPSPKDSSNYERIVSLYTDPGNDLWIGTQENGLMILDGNSRKLKKRFYPQASADLYFPDNTVWCMLPDKTGRVWAGTRNGGLCLVDKEKGVIKRISHSDSSGNALLEKNIRSLVMINDSVLCIGFENKGIQFLNTISNQLFIIHGAVMGKLFAETRVIRGMLYKAPNLWIGTYGKGLIGINLDNGKSLELTEKNGLPNNTIYGIQADNTGSLWLSTNKGICQFVPPANLQSIDRSRFSVYTVEDGLQSNEFNTGAHYQSPDGRLFFGGINGLSIFDPAALAKNNEPVPVIITEILVDNQALQTDTLITYRKNLELSYSQNSLSFSFAALDVIAAGRINYFYQLSGYDKEWVDAGQRNYVAYTNLPPGKYLFRVKANRHYSTSDHAITTIAILIRPPFWRTWWFIASFIMLLAALLYAVYRYRISQLVKLQKVRNNIASDLHDDIGSTLTNISILSELSRQNLAQNKQASVFLDRISEEVQHSGQALDDIVWSINTNNDTLEQTVARMRRYAAEVFDAAGINYTLQFDEKFAQRKLNMEQRRDFLLLFKEAVNNIYKHAQAKNVMIETGIERTKLFMRIRDDGKGFDSSRQTNRNGIKNMKQRVAKWNGLIEIKSDPGQGAETFFTFYIA